MTLTLHPRITHKASALTMGFVVLALLIFALHCPAFLGISPPTVPLKSKGQEGREIRTNMAKCETYFKCWKVVAEESRLRGRWLTDTTWCREMLHAFPYFDTLGFDRGHMQNAFGRKHGNSLDDFVTNTTGRYCRTRRWTTHMEKRMQRQENQSEGQSLCTM